MGRIGSGGPAARCAYFLAVGRAIGWLRISARQRMMAAAGAELAA
jgi:hypothetical protein